MSVDLTVFQVQNNPIEVIPLLMCHEMRRNLLDISLVPRLLYPYCTSQRQEEQGLLVQGAKLSKSHIAHADPFWKLGFNNNL